MYAVEESNLTSFKYKPPPILPSPKPFQTLTIMEKYMTIDFSTFETYKLKHITDFKCLQSRNLTSHRLNITPPPHKPFPQLRN